MVFMQKGTQDWQEEVQYLEHTKNAIATKVQQINDAIQSRRPIVEEMKEQYTHRARDLDSYEKQEVYKRIDDFMLFANEQLELAEHLQKIQSRPYFARVDFVDNEGKNKIYLGLQGVDDGRDTYVIDWRAPVGELFYEYGLGKAQYSAPNGIMSGEVTLKRQYDIQDGILLDAYDVDLNIFDEFLQKILAKVNTAQLHNVASTIQKEQNQIIRDLKSDLIVVQGYVGSGKTTVALHRIAYMLYRLPNLKSTNILIFSPNEVFLRHIAGVLPELGEQNTRTATFPKFVRRLLKLTVPVESIDEFVTRFEGMSTEERNIALQKLDYSMRSKMQDFLTEYEKSLHFTQGFRLRKKVFTRVALNEMLRNDVGTKILDKVENIKQYICKETNITEPQLVQAISDEVLSHLSTTVDMHLVYNLFMNSLGYESIDFGVKIKYEDAILLCIMRELYADLLIKMDIKQVFIDEAQEYSKLFIDFLMRIFPHAQFSMFGDDYQRTTVGAVESLHDIVNLDILHGDKVYYTLDKSYRSSEEIVEYTNALIKANHHNAFRLKVGFPVQELPLADDIDQVSQQVFEILEQVVPTNATVGIIVGDKEYAKSLYDNLAQVIPHRIGLVQDSRSSIDNQIQIVPVALSKGLEYDTAIVLRDEGLFDGEFAQSHLYIACTRAINKLYVFKK